MLRPKPVCGMDAPIKSGHDGRGRLVALRLDRRASPVLCPRPVSVADAPIKSEHDGRGRIVALLPRPKAVSTPGSVLPRLKPCRFFPKLSTFTYAGTWRRFPFPPLAVLYWFPLSLVP